MAAKRGGNMAIYELCNVFTLQGAFILISADNKTKKLIKKSLIRFLRDVHDVLAPTQIQIV